MVLSSSMLSQSNSDIVEINPANKINLKGLRITDKSKYINRRIGNYSSIIRDSLNAALGRKVLLVQFMKGG